MTQALYAPPGTETGPSPFAASDIVTAVRQGHLKPYLQPLFQLTTAEVVAAECLVRWHRAEGEVLEAASIIPDLEAASLLAEVDLASARLVAEDVTRHDLVGRRLERIWLNLSDTELTAEGYLEQLAAMARLCGLGPGRLGIEVATVAFTRETRTVVQRLRDAAGLGMATALDRFDEAALPLLGLQDLALSAVKVDAGVLDVKGGDVLDGEAAATARRLVSAAHDRGLTIIATAVERRDQLEAWSVAGCDQAQGHFFSPPVPSRALWLRRDLSLPPSAWVS